MFFENLENLPALAEKAGFSIFIVPENIINSLQNTGKKRIKTALNAAPFEFSLTTFYLEPEKNTIYVKQIRDLEAEMLNKQTSARFFVVKHAELMNEAAENAALKLLEEPRENCHLVFLATSLSSFLPTVLSRATIYIYKIKDPMSSAPAVSPETLENAKLLLSASPRAALALINRWTTKSNKKDRLEILQILGATIEIAYKSYFKTGNSAFLKKIPSLLTAYENIKGNGHIKLQLTANLC